MTNNVCTVPIEQIAEHPDDPRYIKGDVKTLADSIAEMGLLEPIVVAQTIASEDPCPQPYRVLSGHRRLAALKLLEFPRATVRIVQCDSDRIHELRVIMASNTARENLTPLEEARGYQTMLDLGMAAQDVALVTGRKKDHVERTAKLAGVFSDEHREELNAMPVTLDEAEVLARHEGSDRYGKLLKEVGRPEFTWQTRNADQVAKREAVRAKATAKLQKAGVRILSAKECSSDKHARLDHLKGKDRKKLTIKTHADCPGHAAKINDWAASGADAINYVCADWVKHGHKHEWLTADGGKTDPGREQQKLDREWKKRMKVPLVERREWVKAFIAGNWAAAQNDVVYAALLEGAVSRDLDGGEALACELRGLEVPKSDVDGYVNHQNARKVLIDATDPLRSLVALFCASGDEALRLSKHPTSQGDWQRTRSLRYLSFLEAVGYQPTDDERELAESGEIEEKS